MEASGLTKLCHNQKTTNQLTSIDIIILFLIVETIYSVRTEAHFPVCLLMCFCMYGYCLII
jgi:hypothetical protein